MAEGTAARPRPWQGQAGAAIACAAILGAMTAWAASFSGFSPIDDHHFARTLASGHGFGAHVSAGLGRFIPLVGQEFALAALVGGLSAPVFFAIAALKIALAGILAWVCLWMSGARSVLALVLWCCVLLSIGFANAAFRLQVSEINQLILVLVFIACSLAVEDAGPQEPRRAWAGVALAAMFLSALYKEAAFVFMLAFGLAELLRHRRQGRRVPARIWALIAGGIAYVALYLSWKAMAVTGSYAAFHSTALPDTILLYLSTDPFLFVIVLPLTAVRVRKVLGDATQHGLPDSFLIAASAYAIGYVALGLHSSYYLLPAYAFGVCGVAGLCARHASRAARWATAAAVAALGMNTLPVTLSDLQALGSTANNHGAFVTALSRWLSANPPETGVRTVVLAGVTPASGIEVLVSLRTFLVAQGVPPAALKVKGTEPADNAAIAGFFRGLEMSREMFEEPAGHRPARGDILVLNPYQNVRGRSYVPPSALEPIHESAAQWSIPRWWGWHWGLECFLDLKHCGEHFAAARRYTGYAAYRVK